MRTIQFVDNHFYHIFNRGVDKRLIFQDQADFRRFYQSMYLFNNAYFRNLGGNSSLRDDFQLSSLRDEQSRSPFVRIMSFCILPNHFHLLLEQLQNNGIPQFMHRLGMGYARYFNRRYERIGRLFEGAFKVVHIARDAHLSHLPRYIHLNALDLIAHEWRDGKNKDWDKIKQFLDNYTWSSHQVYCDCEQRLPVVDKGIFREIFPTADVYLRFLREWSGRELPSSLRDEQLVSQ